MKTVRIGSGAGFAGDRIEPAVDLACRGNLDFLVFECLAERTIALAQLRKRSGAHPGYDPLLEDRMRAVLGDCRQNGVRIISNMGAADPRAAAEMTVRIARELGLDGTRVAWTEGDNVFGKLDKMMPFDSDPLPAMESLISANAYLGCEPIVQALAEGADVVLTGRVADPSLFLAPLIHTFGWGVDDWERMGQGTAIGHLLECAGQLTGGYFADPGYKDVPRLEDLGFPLGEVSEDGSALLTKLEGTGGLLSVQTCSEQILYEVLDPARYITPDVCADFTNIRMEQIGPDQVRVSGATGRPRTDSYKVSIGFRNGFFGEGQISYGGPGALPRARLAQAILEKRLAKSGALDMRFDLIGVNSLHGDASNSVCDPYEVRLRAVGRYSTERAAQQVPREVESLYVNGPAGGGGVVTLVKESIAIHPALLPRTAVSWKVHLEVA